MNTTLDEIKEALTQSEAMTTAYIEKLESENAMLKAKIILKEYKKHVAICRKQDKLIPHYKDYKSRAIQELDKELKGE